MTKFSTGAANRHSPSSTRPRVLIQAIFPAPYRTAVFDQLNLTQDLFVAFEKTSHSERNQEWFNTNYKFEAVSLRTKAGRARYRSELKRLSDYDCVVAYDYASFDSILLMARCLRTGVPYMINCDGALPRGWRWRDHVKKIFISRASVCLAGSESAAQYFLTYGADPSRIHRHPFTSLSADEVFSQPATDEERRNLRVRLGLPPDKFLVASVGGFIARKGFDILLKAWTDMPSEAHLLLIGEGPEESAYRSFISRNRLGNVTIVPHQNRASLRGYYRAADTFVLATREDIWGLVVNEAMACGLPVIVTNQCVAGVELIADHENGFVVPSENPDELLVAMTALLSEGAGKRHEIGKRNLLSIEGHTYEAVAKAHNASIKQVTSDNRTERL
jgi:glycosyltransferase involved in cell wall biosynthesis